MLKVTFTIKRHLLLLLLLILAACGGGESDSINTEQSKPASINTSTVNGSVTKGVLVGATIDAYNIAIDGTVDYTTLVASGITDANGLFNLDLPINRGFLLLQSSGGDFIDETDQNPDINLKRKITFLSNEGLTIILPPTYTSVALTMITQSIYEKTLREFSDDFYSVYEANLDKFTTGLGFNPLSTLPADPINPDQSAAEADRQYALLTGGLANIVNQAAVSLGFSLPTYEIIQAIIADFSDGNIDGTIYGTAVSVAGGILPAALDLEAAIIRFKNNNFANFQTTSIPVINYDVLNNILPISNAGPDQTVAEGALVLLSGSASDSDGTVVSSSWTQTQGSTVTLSNNNILNPSFSTPSISVDETAIFKLTVIDNLGGFSTDSVSINIVANKAPVANSDTATVAEGGIVSINIRSNDTDAETPNANLIVTNLSTTTNGSLVDNSDGTVTYTHNGSETIADSFTYTINDGDLESAPTTVNITITPVNDLPTATAQTLSTAEDTALSITLAGTDVDGTISSYTPGTATSGSLTGTAPNLTYTPNSNFNGSDSFTFTVTDSSNGVSAAATINITVTAVNDAPTATAQTVSTAEDTALSITLAGTDVDGTISSYSPSTTASGTLTGTAPNLTYTPNSNFNGSDSFTFTVTDDSSAVSAAATINITVTSVNDLPTATAQTLSTAEDTALSITLAGTDVDGTISSYSPGTATSGTLSGTAPNLTYTPNTNFNGTDSFTFTVTDDSSGVSTAATISITVTSVNDLPSATAQTLSTAEDTALSITLSGTDVDGTISSYSPGTATSGTLSGTAPNLTYTPNSNFNGSDSFTFTVTDDSSGVSAAATINITVTAVNDAPTATAQTVSTAEDTALSITLAGTDVDGTISSYTAGTATSGTLSGTAPNLTYTPNTNFNGTDSFTFTVTDDSSAVSAAVTISITVTSVNDLPSITMPADQNVRVGLPVTVTATASDVDGTVSPTTGYQWAQTSGIDVTASWTNANTQTASFSSPITTSTITLGFTLTATDNDGGQSTTAHNMTVTPVLVADLLPPVVASTTFFADSTLETCVSDNATTNVYTYVHEFVSLDCDSYWVSGDYTGMEQLPNLVTINFTDNYFDDLFSLSSLSLLTTLNLDGAVAWSAGTIDITTLSSLSSLTNLSLTWADVSVADLNSVLPTMTWLTVLDLSQDSITDITFLSALTSLTSLDLSRNSITTIATVSNFTLLETLILNDNQITAIPFSTLSTSLTTLNLNNNDNGPGAPPLDIANDFPDIINLTSLTTLDLGSNMLAVISASSLPTSLITLKLDNNSFTATSAISDLSSMPSLADLDISFNSLSDITSLSVLTWLSGTLNVSNNAAITDLVPLFGPLFPEGSGTDGLINLKFIQADNMSFGHCTSQISDMFRELPSTTLINFGGC